MEKFINNDTIIKDEIYDTFKDSISCPICYNIFIEPIMCIKCQNSFCKQCIDKMEDIKCPNKCEEPNYQKSNAKHDILTNLKFKCKYCKTTIKYDDAYNHKNVCCTELIDSYEIIEDFPIIPTKKRIQKLTGEQMSILKNGKSVTYINRKK